MIAKEELHQLIDALPEEKILSVKDYLEFLVYQNSIQEYDEPLSSEEIHESEKAWKEYMQGRDPGISLHQVIRKFES